MTDAKRFRWIRGATVDALRDRLNAGPVDRVEFHEYVPTDPNSGGLHIVVVYASDESAPTPATPAAPLNESWICPPVCP